MRFALDDDKRFYLVARDGGWDLIVDDERVHYCRTPLEGLRYMAEELREEADVEGVRAVVEALQDIEKQIAKAADVVVMGDWGRFALGYFELVKDLKTRGECVRAVSLEMGGCQSTTELRARPDHKFIVNRAKALLAPLLEARMSERH